MTVSGGPYEIWNFWRATTPPSGRPGDLWMDLSQSPPCLKIVTAASPLTFIAITVGGATSEAVTAAIATHEADTTSVHGIADTASLATQSFVSSAVSTHESDTSSVHGITDTTVLATDAEVATAVSDHSADTTSVHGIADTSVLATASSVATAVSNHESDTSVHGIADTTVLATDAEVATAITNHEAASNPHPTYLTQAEGDGFYHQLTTDMATQAELDTHKTSTDHDGRYYTEAEVDGLFTTHTADTTSVHGIADTSVLATDAEVATAISDHVGLADPHTQYQKESEKGNANGYASLDGSGLVPDAQIPSTIARDSELHARQHSITDTSDHTFPGGTTTYLRADGTFAGVTPADPAYAPGTFTLATGTFRVMAGCVKLTSSQTMTLAGTALLRIV